MGFIVGKAYPMIKSMAESGNSEAKKLLDGLESMDQVKVDEMVGSLLGGGDGSNQPRSFTDIAEAEDGSEKPKKQKDTVDISPEFAKGAKDAGRSDAQIENFERTALMFKNLAKSEKILSEKNADANIELARKMFLEGDDISQIRSVLNIENYAINNGKAKKFPVKNRENLVLVRKGLDVIYNRYGGDFSVEEDIEKGGRPSSWNAMDDIVKAMKLEHFNNTVANLEDKKSALGQILVENKMSDKKKKMYNGIIKVIDLYIKKKKEEPIRGNE